jgi:hypothetical protein
LKDVQLPTNSVISFLSTKENLQWNQQGNNAVISLPDYDPAKMKAPYAYVIKIADFGKFAHEPRIDVAYPNGSLAPVISFEKNNNEDIHYTIDGSKPDDNSTLYTKPFSINNNVAVKAISVLQNALSSDVSELAVKKYNWMKAEKLKNPKPGIEWKYYEPNGDVSLESIQNSPVKKEGITTDISEKVKQRQEKYALQFNGYIKIDKDGIYNFSTASDDGSKLFIDDEEIVNNDGEHGNMKVSGKAALKKGYHKLKVTYFDGGGVNNLKVLWSANDDEEVIIPASLLFH